MTPSAGQSITMKAPCWWWLVLAWQNRALTHRIAHLIGAHGVDPAQVLAVTFTNKAAGK